MTDDLIIIGGSFAGLSAALQLARAGRTVRIIDAGKPFARADRPGWRGAIRSHRGAPSSKARNTIAPPIEVEWNQAQSRLRQQPTPRRW
jgi:thioredoxin reductase